MADHRNHPRLARASRVPSGSRLNPAARFALGFCAAPILPAVLQTWIVSESVRSFSMDVLVIVGGILYAMQLVIGVPGYLLLQNYRRNGLAAHLVVGFASVAISLSFATLGFCRNLDCLAEELHHAFSLGLLGVLMGAVFWLILRPDRHGPTFSLR